jgi:hypothetical protein
MLVIGRLTGHGLRLELRLALALARELAEATGKPAGIRQGGDSYILLPEATGRTR